MNLLSRRLNFREWTIFESVNQISGLKLLFLDVINFKKQYILRFNVNPEYDVRNTAILREKLINYPVWGLILAPND